ncbi:hypothetical protein [Paraburkholderia caribensis]|uniref:hypothetical protein n=1 Tax=Paraburkholderia caribensis TaxID=75105 RepID=UPI0029C9C83D|nr:hypothetical protein [Paraburkholderia caribensis]
MTHYGPFVEEWKTEKKLIQLAKENPDRIFKRDGTWYCPERETYFKSLGITFCLRSSDEHDDLFAANLEHLSSFLDGKARPVSDDALLSIKKLLDKRGGAMSLAALNHAAYEDDTPINKYIEFATPRGRFRFDDVLKAIADQQVFVDLGYDDLSESHTTVVCSTPEQLELVKWRRPPPHAVSTHFVLNVEIGTEFMFRGRPDVYTVTALPEGKVLFRDATYNTFETLGENQFQSLMFSDEVQLLSPQKIIDELLAENPPSPTSKLTRQIADLSYCEGLKRLTFLIPTANEQSNAGESLGAKQVTRRRFRSLL